MSPYPCYESIACLGGHIVSYFVFLDFKETLKIQLSAVGKMYNICAMFTNTHTCLFQSMTTSYFAIEPPQSDEYFT